MKAWLKRLRRKASDRTAMLPISEIAIDPKVVLEADTGRVVLSLYSPSENHGWRSAWDRGDVERIHAALGRWLETGSLETQP